MYTIKNVSCWKKSQGGSIYHKISKYSYSFPSKHVIVVKNGGCNTSHSEGVEQAFYTKYTGK